MTTLKEQCPVCDKEMVLAEIDKTIVFRDVEIDYKGHAFSCPDCQMEVGTLEQTTKMQKTISEAYRRKVGLLTGDEIRENRNRLGLTQKALADKMTIGIASIKRWEGGIIQSKHMDKALRDVFWKSKCENDHTGNRNFSIPRAKVVINFFESLLGIHLLIEGDKMLFAAKYLWYADFLAHRDLGQSMTGATYAKLTYGPQFNNYRDLIAPIKSANEKEAEPLNLAEKNILEKIFKTFPTPRSVYDASHREKIWKEGVIGAIIPYSDSADLQEL